MKKESYKVNLSTREEDKGISTTDATFYAFSGTEVVVLGNKWKSHRKNGKLWYESVVLDADEMEKLITAWQSRPKLPESGNGEGG